MECSRIYFIDTAVEFWNDAALTDTRGQEFLICIGFAAESVQITTFLGISRVAVVVENL